MILYLDTHVVLWLYAGALELISERARELLEEGDIYISPMVMLELEYLKESQRITKSANQIYQMLERDLNLKICEKKFPAVISESLQIKWTRDPFDRIIVAQASLNAQTLLTKDTLIHQHYPKAIW